MLAEFFRGPGIARESDTQAPPDQLHIWCSWHGGDGEPGLPRGGARKCRGSLCASLEVSNEAAAATAHFVVDLATDPLGDHWIYAGSLTPFNKSDAATVAHPPGEPTPVYEDGAPGDAATVRYFIARQPTGHKGPGALAIGLYKLSWLPPQ